MNRVLVVGATSAIAEAVGRRLARDGARLVLAGRDGARLQAVAADLRVRGAREAHTFLLDVNDADRHAALVDAAVGHLGGLDLVLVAHGTLPDQATVQRDPDALRQALLTNFVSTALLLERVAARLEAQRAGVLAVLGSVAGDRGRQSNYAYGAAKAGLAAYVQGLRHRLHACGATVVTIKPGFVDTPMTAHLARTGPLWSSPDRVARGILSAVRRRAAVAYVPGYWRWIMFAVRIVPERLFVRTHL